MFNGPHRLNWVPLLLAITVLALIGGCSSTKLAPREEDQKAKDMQPEAGRGLVYVYRFGWYQGIVSYLVRINEDTLDGLDPDEYYLLDVPAGRVSIATDIGKFYTDAAGKPLRTKIIEVPSGARIYVQVLYVYGAGVYPVVVDETQWGRAEGDCKLIKTIHVQ